MNYVKMAASSPSGRKIMGTAKERLNVWFAPGDKYFPVKSGEDVKLMMENCSWLGITKIFPLARINHSRLTSPIMKHCPSIRFVETIGKVDILEEMTKQAPGYGIEIHPWIMCNHADRDGGGSYPEEWLIRSVEDKPVLEGDTAQFACPNNEMFLEQHLRLTREVLVNYDVQGLHLDFIRYPINLTCRCSTCRKRCHEQFGEIESEGYKDFVWHLFCRDSIIHEVEKYFNLTQSLHKRLSAAVFVGSFNAENIVKQDWSTFSIFLDEFYVMAYETPVTAMDHMCRDVKQQSHSLHPGVGLGINDCQPEDAKTREYLLNALQIVKRHGLNITFWNYEWLFASRLAQSKGLSAATLQEVFQILQHHYVY